MKILIFCLFLNGILFAMPYSGCKSEKPNLFCKGIPIGLPDNDNTFKKHARFFAINTESGETCFGSRDKFSKVDAVSFNSHRSEFGPYPSGLSIRVFDNALDEAMFDLHLMVKTEGHYRLEVLANLELGSGGSETWLHYFEPIDGLETSYSWTCHDDLI